MEIKDYAGSWVNDPASFENLPGDKQQTLLDWISENVEATSKPGFGHSYFWKHIFEHDSRMYCTNGAFVGAMLAAGFKRAGGPPQQVKFKAAVRNVKTRPTWA